MNKPLNWILWIALTLLGAPAQTQAYYDPAPQRWINRDPVAEKSDRNLYRAVINSPMNRVDAYGLQAREAAAQWAAPVQFPVPPTPGSLNIPPPCAPYPACLTRPYSDFDRCWDRCMATYGQPALLVLGISTAGGGTVPSPVPKPIAGAKPTTTIPSLIELGMEAGGLNLGNKLRHCARRVNPVMTCVQVGAASFCAGLPAGCSFACALDPLSY